MKKKTPKNKYVSVKDAELLERIIASAKERWTIKDIVLYFTDGMDWSERRELIETLMKDAEMKEDITGDLKDGLANEGYTVLKVETMEKRSKLEEFVNSILFPYYNDQQAALFV